MAIIACLIDRDLNPISDDFEIVGDDFDSVVALARSKAVACAIQWCRDSDGQLGYWGPNGAIVQPHFFNGNRNAAKDDADKALSYIHARCRPEDKVRWVKAAQAKKLKLTEWIVLQLNSGC